MDTLQAWGSQLIAAWQTAQPGWAPLMRNFSGLGNEDLYFLIIFALYWCLDPALGVQLGVAFVCSSLLNPVCKLVFHLPRPYWTDPAVRAFTTETTYGLPSGHAQEAVVMWGQLGVWGTQQMRGHPLWRWVGLGVCGGIILGISLSRIYLGAHFPHDVLAGWAVGGVLVGGVWRWRKSVGHWWRTHPGWQHLSVSLGGTLCALAIFAWIGLWVNRNPDPPSWAAQALAATGTPIAPRAGGVVSVAGMLFGLGVALALLARRPHCWPAVPQSWFKRAARLGLGLAGAWLLGRGLGAVFPTGTDWVSASLRFGRFVLAAVWVFYLAPCVFEWVRLGDSPAVRAKPQ